MAKVKVTVSWEYSINMQHYPECSTEVEALTLDREMYENGEVGIEDILPVKPEANLTVNWELVK